MLTDEARNILRTARERLLEPANASDNPMDPTDCAQTAIDAATVLRPSTAYDEAIGAFQAQVGLDRDEYGYNIWDWFDGIQAGAGRKAAIDLSVEAIEAVIA